MLESCTWCPSKPLTEGASCLQKTKEEDSFFSRPGHTTCCCLAVLWVWEGLIFNGTEFCPLAGTCLSMGRATLSDMEQGEGQRGSPVCPPLPDDLGALVRWQVSDWAGRIQLQAAPECGLGLGRSSFLQPGEGAGAVAWPVWAVLADSTQTCFEASSAASREQTVLVGSLPLAQEAARTVARGTAASRGLQSRLEKAVLYMQPGFVLTRKKKKKKGWKAVSRTKDPAASSRQQPCVSWRVFLRFIIVHFLFTALFCVLLSSTSYQSALCLNQAIHVQVSGAPQTMGGKLRFLRRMAPNSWNNLPAVLKQALTLFGVWALLILF